MSLSLTRSAIAFQLFMQSHQNAGQYGLPLMDCRPGPDIMIL